MADVSTAESQVEDEVYGVLDAYAAAAAAVAAGTDHDSADEDEEEQPDGDTNADADEAEDEDGDGGEEDDDADECDDEDEDEMGDEDPLDPEGLDDTIPADLQALLYARLTNSEDGVIDEYDDDDDIGYRRVVVSDADVVPYTADVPSPSRDPRSPATANKSIKKQDEAAAENDDDGVTADDLEQSRSKQDNRTPQSKRSEEIFDSFDLRVVFLRGHTGFEESKEFPVRIGSVVAGRYQVLEYLGSAAFSKAVQCIDLVSRRLVCIKIIKNNKDFLDQSLDEIKLLQYINAACDPDEKHVLRLLDYFYFKEHLFIVSELLRDNLYEFAKYNRESGDEPYFTLPRLQRITRQCMIALEFIHSLKLMHCDLKPENILIQNYARGDVKMIDFGSSCFVTDHLSSYVQSRSYRAPEVVLGLPYEQVCNCKQILVLFANTCLED